MAAVDPDCVYARRAAAAVPSCGVVEQAASATDEASAIAVARAKCSISKGSPIVPFNGERQFIAILKAALSLVRNVGGDTCG